jgi:alkylation response protein AidB-like acyl-CoA dehydrogenase
MLGVEGEALPLLESVIDEAILAMGGEALGAMQVLLDATVQYTSTREQFGQPIGKFQALQHRRRVGPGLCGTESETCRGR